MTQDRTAGIASVLPVPGRPVAAKVRSKLHDFWTCW